jgi:hypothetical protein
MCETDHSIGIKRTPQQNKKINNVAQDDEQHHCTHTKKTQKRKNLIFVKATYLN